VLLVPRVGVHLLSSVPFAPFHGGSRCQDRALPQGEMGQAGVRVQSTRFVRLGMARLSTRFARIRGVPTRRRRISTPQEAQEGASRCGRRCVSTRASAEGAHLVAEGMDKYGQGDKMGALRCFERAAEQSESMQVKRAAYYNQCCCHTYFGDLELAQFALRDAILCGLDYAQAQEDPTLLRMEASAQVRNQLRSFAAGRQSSSGTKQKREYERMKREGTNRGANMSPMQGMLEDIDTGSNVDVTVGGLVRRVSLVIVAFVAVFFGLTLLLQYYLGASGLK